MREKLIKLLYQAPCESDLEGRPGSCPYRKYGRCGEVDRLDYCAVQRLADHLIANGVVISNSEKTSKWIPVTERLPDLELVEAKANDEDLFPCLCAIPHKRAKGGVWVAKMWYTGEGFIDSDSVYWSEVTHWMPLPEPPKGE